MDWNNINTDKDTSGLGPIEYEQTKVPTLIRKHADNVRTKTYGQEVREAQARNAEIAGLIANEAVDISNETKERQDTVETQFNSVQQELTDKDPISAPEIIVARNGEPTLSARLDKEQQEVTTQLAQIMPFANKVIFASNYDFTNTTADGAMFKNLLETIDADILYIDTDILIDVDVRLNIPKIRKIKGLGGTITLTNKGTSKTPRLSWEYGNNLHFDGVHFLGDFDKTLTTDTEWRSVPVSPLDLTFCEDFSVINCTLENLVGAGAIWSRNCKNGLIKNNNIINCWNHVKGDYQGDGIYVAWGDGVDIIGNTIKNDFPDIDSFGRIGITFEFDGTKNCICADNYVYGYDRAFHAELVGGSVLIKNNISEGCAIGFIGWENNKQDVVFEGNYCTNKGVPETYLVQVTQGTNGFLSLYSNGILAEVNANTVIKNNTFILEVDVGDLDEFVVTKISGEEYYDNVFIDKNRSKRLLMYNPNETTINNNNFVFKNNRVEAQQVYFGNIGKHQINDNTFDVEIFSYICAPTPSLASFERQFLRNEVKNGESGIVQTPAYLFNQKVSLMLQDNYFVDIEKKSTEQDTLIRLTQDYSTSPFLKIIMDNNTLVSTQANTITNLFFAGMDTMVFPTTTNKKITSGGMIYQSSGYANQTLVVTTPSGNEKTITVDDTGALSTVGQRWK